jgi:hypothetical protein
MSEPFIAGPRDRADRAPGPRELRFLLVDGQSLEMGQGGVHWQIARFLLDAVLPDPRRDVDRPGVELRRAERFCRRALELDPALTKHASGEHMSSACSSATRRR